MTAHPDRVVLEVIDDGLGMGGSAGLAAAASAPTGFGLSGMRQRAELLGGKLAIISAPGRGTTVRLMLPLTVPPVPDRAG